MNTKGTSGRRLAGKKEMVTARETAPRKTAEPAVILLPQDMNPALAELADLAMRYPFRWFPQGKVAHLCGFGDAVLTALVGLGAPIVARKCNPHLLHKWLMENLDKVGKIRLN